MLWWMGAVLLLACILISRRSIGQPMREFPENAFSVLTGKAPLSACSAPDRRGLSLLPK
jgi:hypothetical protein